MLHIRTLRAEDISLGMQLKSQAGWNQIPEDWLRFLELQPGGCFLGEWQGQPVATAVTCTFGRVGWIAMLLVDSSHRRRGIGGAMMQQALEHLESLGVRSVRLDATPLGRPIYEKLGFEPQFELARCAGMACPPSDWLHGPHPAADATDRSLRPVRLDDLEAIGALDQAVVGYDRREFLRRLYTEWPEGGWMSGLASALRGFMLARRGSQAIQVGPCMGEAESGNLLLQDALRRFAGQAVYVDVPLRQETAVDAVRSAGLTVQRTLTRMCLGEPVLEQRELFWTSSGPELG